MQMGSRAAIYPGALFVVSLGERHLVHLAHAVVRRQRLLLLDDVRLRQALQQLRDALVVRLEAQRQLGVVERLAHIAQLLSSERPTVQRLRIGAVEFQRCKCTP